MIDIKVSADATLRDLKRAEADILAAGRQTLGQVAAFVAETARTSGAWHDRTGAARQSIHRETVGDYEQRVVAGGRPAPHVLFLEDGTKAHEIRAVNAKALRFVAGGQVRFASVVHHPGTKPTHFMQDARDKGEAVFVQFLEHGLSSIGG